ncbi:MAG: aminodeoxychorismate synthase component I [Candidatus Omnitrophota bacterium]
MLFTFSEPEIKEILAAQHDQPYVFLESATPRPGEHTSFLFNHFSEIITFRWGDDINAFFRTIEDRIQNNFWLCGYFTYEFGYFLEPALYHLREKSNTVLAWLGVSKEPFRFDHHNHKPSLGRAPLFYRVTHLTSTIDKETYRDHIAIIKSYLETGLTYQVNYTFKMKFDFTGDPIDLYLALRRGQPTSYLACINTGSENILSFSPELFFRLSGDTIVTKPMKGTHARGLAKDDDEYCRRQLKRDKKSRAENIMIVDLLRNDLGKIAYQVNVPVLFETEQHRTLHQMTSTVRATLPRQTSAADIVKALFPSGSVTGAPKIKTMQLIKDLEAQPRNIYTGAIGYISPQHEMCFNVAIRTISISGHKGEMGIGGGIVYDSTAENEYEEALLKSKFLTQEFPQFSLIESLLWQNNKGYFLLEEHLRRLKNSCSYFSIPVNMYKIRRELKMLEKKIKGEKTKIRIILSTGGELAIESQPLEGMTESVTIKVSPHRVNPQDIFLYHKTTRRKLYDEALKGARMEGFFEVMFLNVHGQVTEGSVSNIFIEKGKLLYTPPTKCGLLGGVLRQHLLDKGVARERVLYIKDILSADTLYIGNSVRGLIKAEISLADFENKSTIEIQVENCKR